MTHVISEEKAFEIVQEFLTDILQISPDVLALYVIGSLGGGYYTPMRAPAPGGGGGEDVYGTFQNNDEADHAADRIHGAAAGGKFPPRSSESIFDVRVSSIDILFASIMLIL